MRIGVLRMCCKRGVMVYVRVPMRYFVCVVVCLLCECLVPRTRGFVCSGCAPVVLVYFVYGMVCPCMCFVCV